MFFTVVENKANNIEHVTLQTYSSNKTGKTALKKNSLAIGSEHCHQDNTKC